MSNYIFYDNLNNECPITLIFGIVSSQTMHLCISERWFHFSPHLSSATALPWDITEHKNN